MWNLALSPLCLPPSFLSLSLSSLSLSLSPSLPPSLPQQGTPPTPESKLKNPYEEIEDLPPKAPTIEQLLAEIEKEYLGPDYKYQPPEGGLAFEGGLENGDRDSDSLYVTMHSRESEQPLSSYDSLTSSSLPANSYLPPEEMRAIETAFQKTFRAYESSSASSSQRKPSSEDDTYVYMAPCQEIECDSPRHSSR